MKKLYTFFICLFLLGAYAEAQYVTIPDVLFKTLLKEKYPASFNGSDMMDTTSYEIVNEDSLDTYSYLSYGIQNLEGLKYFKNLVYLDCSSMKGGSTLTDIPFLPGNLKYLDCSGCFRLKNIPQLPGSLQYLNCAEIYNLTTLPILPSTLEYLNCSNNNNLTDLPILPNTLKYLNCSNGYGIKNLPTLSSTSLEYLNLFNSQITNIPTLPNTLKYLNCSNCHYLTTLPALSTSLTYLNSTNTSITSLQSLPGNLDTLECGLSALTSLPPLPPTLTYLDCAYNRNINDSGITTMPNLPSGLKFLNCSSNPIMVLPNLPNGLITLYCSGNGLTTLPPIPASLLHLDFYYNQISSFPILPNTLKNLSCGHNPIKTIPNWPDSLQILDCSLNQLTTLPVLPKFLTYLDCSYNELLNLPVLSDTLATLYCRNNKLSSLPDLPKNLSDLTCQKNNIYCLPKLPDSDDPRLITLNITMDAYKISCIPNRPRALFLKLVDSNSLSIPSFQFPLCTPVNNVNHCQSFSIIQGNVFNDLNSNGIKDANEFYMPNINIHLSNIVYAYTDKNGNYEIGTNDTGHYNITVTSPYSYYTPNPISKSYYFTTNDSLVIANFALQPNANVDSFKINVHEINSAARPGFSFPYLVSYENIGTTTVAPAIVFNYDNSLFIYDSSSNHNVINTGTNLSLTESSMLPGEQRSFYIYLRVKTTAVLGTWFTSLGAISANSSFAQDSTFGQIKGSFDPNDKQATPIMSTTEISQGKFINYSIRFQNTGTDTTFTVVVTDTLSALLQENTFELINASHPCNATRNGKNLTFEFLNILLPDSNVNEPGSHGYINFRVKPKSPLALNTIINNKAFIYFDYNLPVITNTAQTSIQNNTTVPIKLIRFYANVLNDGYTQLNWLTANEVNTSLYTLQQSTDGVNYKNVSTVSAKQFGNNQYSIKTLSLNIPVVYYRLKITDADGGYAYSLIITVKKQTDIAGLIVSNNVTGDNLQINVQDGALVNTTARVLNTEGVVVKNITLKQGIQNISINNLASGNYYLQTNAGVKKITIK